MVSSLWTQARNRITSRFGVADPRQREYTVLVLLAVLAGTATGWIFDFSSAAILAGLTAIFALVGAGGQALRTDLHRFAWFAPALILVTACGPLLVHLPVLAGLLVAAVVFGSGMLPAAGEHYRISGQAFAAATLVSTTTSIGSDQPVWVVFLAAVSGALFALLLRIMIGMSDPTRATRIAVARTLIEPGPGVVELAAAAWRADGASTWLGQVLAGAARFRAARETLLAQAQRAGRPEASRLQEIVTEAELVAIELAKAVRARACIGLPPAARANPAAAVSTCDGQVVLPDAVQGINQGLDRIREAVVRRDESPATAPSSGSRRERVMGAVRAHLSLRSSLFRHALRCTFAVGIGMVVVLLLRDATVSSLLLALYLVLQPAARDSMTGALERTAGTVLGVVALAVSITVLPGAFLIIPLVIGGMLLHVDQLRDDYRLLLGCLIVITVIDQAMRLDRPLVDVAIGFAGNTAIGTAIGLIIGFVSYLVLPSSLVPDVRGAVRATVWSVSELLRSVRAAERVSDLHEALQSAHVLALRRTQDLLGMPALLDGTGEDDVDVEEQRAIRAAAIALDALRQDVATLAFRPASERSVAIPALHAVDDLLGGKTTAKIPDVASGRAPATELLASSLVENALHARAAIDRTFGYDLPWRSYTISFIRPERLHIR